MNVVYKRPKARYIRQMDDIDNQWFPILGFEDYATMGGKIYRVRESSSDAKNLTYKPLRPSKNPGGYLIGTLYKNGKRASLSWSSAICAAAHGQRPDGMQCCHNDNDKFNNLPSNLRWDTPSANSADKKKHGTHQQGEKHGSSKIDNHKALAIRHDAGSCRETALKFGVSRQLVSKIRRKELWAHI